VAAHVDFITPTLHFDTPLNIKHRRGAPNPWKRKRAVRTLAEAEAVDVASEAPMKAPGRASEAGTLLGSLPKQGAILADDAGISDAQLEDCDKTITPNCLRALYQMPEGKTANPKNSLG
jgi:tripeptidyl-peptidase-1